IAAEGVLVARLLAHLVGGVLLRARIEEDVAEARREAERTLLAVQDVRQAPARALVGQRDALPLVQAVPNGGVALEHEPGGHDRLALRAGGREVDVVRVLRVPEVLLGARDDLLEVRGAARVACGLDHGGEVVRVRGPVGRIVGHRARACAWPPCRVKPALGTRAPACYGPRPAFPRAASSSAAPPTAP